MKQERRFAVINVSYQNSVQMLSAVFAALPPDARLVRVMDQIDRGEIGFVIESRRFKITPMGEMLPEIRLVFKAVEDGPDDRHWEFESLDWPVPVEFAGLKRKGIA